MRAAAVAIVFIFGAAVILVFANSLNSWVLGGLIGGLAALLISIPISVMLFTFLSRHHDLKLQAIHQELGEMGYVDLDENGYEELYETDAYVLSDEEYYNQAENRRKADVRALPAAGQSQATAKREFTERTGRGKGTPTRDLSSDRPQSRRSMYEVNAMRSRFQTAALHAARLEAQQFDDVEVKSTRTQASNKRVPSGRTSQPLAGQATRSRQAPSEGSHRTFDPTSGQQNGPRRTISSGELYSANRPPRTDALHTDDLQADRRRVRSSYPETDSLRMRPQTGQMARHPQSGDPLRGPDMMTGNLKTPLVRRAPYLYEDDPLREELAQQIDGRPIVRRSSRNVQSEDED